MMTAQKQVTLVAALERLLTGCQHSRDEIETLLGRLQWATMAFPYTKPFMQPLWAWKQAVQTSGHPGQLVKMLGTLMLMMLSKPLEYPSPFLKLSKWHGASDAGATETTATIGGWLTDQKSPTQRDVLWFSLILKPEIFPWLFDKARLSDRISSM
jgi:hypothetical protein